MMPDATNAWLVGVDGCPVGWVAAFLRPFGDDATVRLIPRFADLAAEPASVIAVDMPIGLPERTGPGGRAAENLVRPLLGARQSSVFSVPSRAAVNATDFRSACETALATSDPPRMISRQLFMLVPKIREVDTALRADTGLAARTFEVHPELAFWRLNGERALTEPKKIKGRPYEPGLALRRRLLVDGGCPTAVAAAPPPRGAGPDDLLDALACAMVARRIHAGLARPFPDRPPFDAFGLPMAIWA
jgi:predicted RNase H-like nuclease